jgi:glycosyltransferase involved in cell wall biosynthesis
MTHPHETGPNVLLSAYYCAPGGGSVSHIGWEWYARLSREIPVTLVTHSRNRQILSDAGAPFPGSTITYIDTEWFAGPLYRLAKFLFKRSEHAIFLLTSLDFYLFDFVVLRRFRKASSGLNLVHVVTPVSPLAVTRLHKLGLPLIVGPWNGGVSTLAGFTEIMRADSEWIYGVRMLRGLLDRLTGCTKNARRVLTATVATDQCLPPSVPTERMIENGVDLDVFSPGGVLPPSPANPLQILFVGRLIPAKGLTMLLSAAARIHSAIPLRILIAGDGAIRETLEEQVRRDGLSDVVTFLGRQNQEQIVALMRQSHALCLPSIRESGGAVLLEAMACEIPVLTVANGGPGELADEEVGRALTADSPEMLIQGLAAALTDMYCDAPKWKQRGINGRRRAERQYGWPARIQRAIDIYQKVLEEQHDFPNRDSPHSGSPGHEPPGRGPAQSGQPHRQRETLASAEHRD